MTAFVVQHTVRTDLGSALVIEDEEPRYEWPSVEEEFGPVRQLFHHTPMGYDIDVVNSYARRSLAKFDPEKDCIIAMGSPVLIGISMAWAARASGGYVCVLEWDRKLGAYYAREWDMAKEGEPF